MNAGDFAWLVEHSDEIFREYAGKWIAVHDGKIIGVGDTATEAAAQAETKGPNTDFILEAVEINTEMATARLIGYGRRPAQCAS